MARIPTAELSRYLLSGQINRQGCLRLRRTPFLPRRPPCHNIRPLSTTTPPTSPAVVVVPLRKQLKDQAKALKSSGSSPRKKKKNSDNQTVPGWELTVGIEIHAQLNTSRKLFSPALVPESSLEEKPNTHVSPFDLAIPGSQPLFQPDTLIPAVRAALALNCEIEPVSYFDRKHYFHWDQPAGYQITQFYHPFARHGKIVLYSRDGIAAEDGDRIEVGIQQVQMEQDTAKTLAQPGGVNWLDFNRVGVPLIEIITRPEIHHPATAAALVRKVQMLLGAVDACTSGLEAGGLRADVNVSVRRPGEDKKLGQRTEIKNLSSFKAVEDAIIAERDRQIAVLEAGGTVAGETRGWSLGGTETRRLRGKEGEVDYRYMPDPDLGAVVIGKDLVEFLGRSMGVLPDEEVEGLMGRYGLTAKDAMALMLLDEGGRVEYFYEVLGELEGRLGGEGKGEGSYALLAANWCLHELGKLTEGEDAEPRTGLVTEFVAAGDLAAILYHLHRRKITAKTAKALLWGVFNCEVAPGGVTDAIERGGLWFQELSEEEYAMLADKVVEGEEGVLAEFLRFKQGKSKGYPQGKLMFLVGKMMKMGPEQNLDPASVKRVLGERIEGVYLPQLEGEEK
ncbi:Glutamyl-tRNA amidotransferase subunit B, mitochondrial [Podospora australis]|uniref:Glutamyl-tRNA(Gln) amidotransferase subunit B, mitochondrial n=1 Tax=Podospora australis TaxID=1536484 RepID=A0AAN6X3T0_9PEZI|nr:Glutamyl-tRNA amidotransferase subunit B, mitochondrial [Podospora australis]